RSDPGDGCRCDGHSGGPPSVWCPGSPDADRRRARLLSHLRLNARSPCRRVGQCDPIPLADVVGLYDRPESKPPGAPVGGRGAVRRELVTCRRSLDPSCPGGSHAEATGAVLVGERKPSASGHSSWGHECLAPLSGHPYVGRDVSEHASQSRLAGYISLHTSRSGARSHLYAGSACRIDAGAQYGGCAPRIGSSSCDGQDIALGRAVRQSSGRSPINSFWGDQSVLMARPHAYRRTRPGSVLHRGQVYLDRNLRHQLLVTWLSLGSTSALRNSPSPSSRMRANYWNAKSN